MDCNQIKDSLLRYLENNLSSDEKQAIEKHINQCTECANILKDIKTLTSSFKELPSEQLPINIDKELSLKLQSVKESLNSSKPRVTIPKVLVPTLAAVFAILVFVIIYNNEKTSDSTKPTKTDSVIVQKEAPIVSENKLQAAKEPIIIKRTLKLSKATPVEKSDDSLLFRGTGDLETKRIIRQWQDIYSGYKEKESLVIESKEKWQELWSKHSQNINPKSKMPEIDFTENIAVAVFMGEKKSTGYGIQISRVDDSGTKIYVSLEETVPSPGASVTRKPTQPYHIVVVNRD